MCTRFCRKTKKYNIQDKGFTGTFTSSNGTQKPPTGRKTPQSQLEIKNLDKSNDLIKNEESKTPQFEKIKKPPQTPDITLDDKPIIIEESNTQEDKRPSEDISREKLSINAEPTEIKNEEERRPGVIPLPVSFDENSIDDIEKHPKAPE